MHALSFSGPLFLPLAASLGLSLFSWGKYALYPFKLFTTWVHECCHALMALLVGGRVKKITFAADTSGVTHYQIPRGRIPQALVASAGYLGSSAVGCLLYSLSCSSFARNAPLIELGLGACMWLTGLFWVRGAFGILTVASIGASLVTLGALVPLGLVGSQLQSSYARPFFAFLAIQTGLNALLDIRTLFEIDPGTRSDAHTMQSVFWLPAWFWALLWLSLSLAMAYWTVI